MKNVFSFFFFLFPMFVVSCCNTQEFCCKTLLCDTALRKLSLMWCHCCFWRTWWLESSQPNATDYPLISLLYSTYSAPVWALYLSTLAALPWSLVTLSDSRFLRHWRQLRLIMRMYLLFNHSRRPCVGGRQYCNWPSSLSGAKWMSDQRWFPALVSSLFYFIFFFLSFHSWGGGVLWWNCTVHPPPPRQVHTPGPLNQSLAVTKWTLITRLWRQIWIGIQSSPFALQRSHRSEPRVEPPQEWINWMWERLRVSGGCGRPQRLPLLSPQ